MISNQYNQGKQRQMKRERFESRVDNYKAFLKNTYWENGSVSSMSKYNVLHAIEDYLYVRLK